MTTLYFKDIKKFKDYMLIVDYSTVPLKDLNKLIINSQSIRDFMRNSVEYNLLKNMTLRVYFDDKEVLNLDLDSPKLIRSVFPVHVEKSRKHIYHFPVYKNFKCVELDDILDIYEIKKTNPSFTPCKLLITVEYETTLSS